MHMRVTFALSLSLLGVAANAGPCGCHCCYHILVEQAGQASGNTVTCSYVCPVGQNPASSKGVGEASIKVCAKSSSDGSRYVSKLNSHLRTHIVDDNVDLHAGAERAEDAAAVATGNLACL